MKKIAQSKDTRRDESMGCLQRSTPKNRLRLYGQSTMLRCHSPNNESNRLPPRFHHCPRLRGHCQRHDTLHDLATQNRSKYRLLQQTVG